MSYRPTRRKRLAGGVLAGAMALSVTPIIGLTGTASADHLPPVADPIGEGNVCEDAPNEEPFTDVDTSDNSYDEIVCLFQAGITQGKTATTYAPAGDLTRREMALFLTRLANTANENEATGADLADLPPYDNVDDYPDVATESQNVKEAIDQLSQVEIALGFTDGTYRPGATLKRRQMAKFIVRELEFLTGDTLTSSDDYFPDDDGDSAEDEFNILAELGIFQGDTDGNVNPGQNLSRRQMANILLRTLEVLFEDGDITRLFEADAAPNAAASLRPELTGAEIMRTDGSGSQVRFTFDEEVTGDTPTANLFHVYDQDGEQFDGSGTPTIEDSNNSVLVDFAAIDMDSEAQRLTVATVDFGAVEDDEGLVNPIGDAPLGTSGETTFITGRTEAPDLREVQNFVTNAATTSETLVDFVFDENAFVVNADGFFLVTVGGELISCSATTTTDGFTGDGTPVITASCENTQVTGKIDADEVARGYVIEATVSDADQPMLSTSPAGNVNALQATETPDANSTEPDLGSASLEFNTDQSAGTTDSVVFTFDLAVELLATAGTGTTAEQEAGAQFRVYDDEGTEFTGATAAQGNTASEIVVTFADGEIDNAVGASVEADAVRAATGDTTRQNEADEEGVTNPRTDVRTAGRTANPDLTGVAIENDTGTGNPQAIYTFDEDVDLVGTGDDSFYLLLSSGVRLVCTDGEATNPTGDDQDQTIRCGEYAVANADGTPSADLASDDQVRSAVAGSVDDDAVIGEDDTLEQGFGTFVTDTAFGNPEGAELTTGGTGTPQS